MTVPLTAVAVTLALISQQPATPAQTAELVPATDQTFTRVYSESTVGLVPPAPPTRFSSGQWLLAVSSAGLKGTVLLDITVGADGRVTDAMVTKSDLPDWTDDEAVKAVSQWVFKPGTLDGRVVAVRSTATFATH